MERESTRLNLRAEGNVLIKRAEQFWNWWLSELLGIFPPHIQDKLQRRGACLIAELCDDQYSIRYGSRGNLNQVTSFNAEDTLQAERSDFQAELSKYARKADDIILLLPSRLMLSKRISLPSATEGGLANVLRFEMDRHTPFTAEQVYYGYRIAERDPKNQRIHVDLKLMPRDTLDPFLTQVRSFGINPTVVAPADDKSDHLYSVNLLPEALRPGGRKGKSNRLQLVALVLLLILAITLPVIQQEARVETLRSEIQGPKALAEEAQAISAELKTLMDSRKFLIEKKNSDPSVLQLLDELTRLMPDHTWISRFEVRGTEVKLQGESREASALIGLLEGSGYLTDVRFSSPVTSNPRTQKERFVILAQLRKEERS